MKVNLIGITNPTEITGCTTAEELIAYCARISNPSNQYNHETGAKLIRSLIRDNHWSPLEMVNVVIWVETTRDIARQILRHRSFCFQEFSQRYAVANKFELREARLQDTKNRQNSLDTASATLKQEWSERQALQIQITESNYKWALDNGIAKEQARAILPEGLTSSTLYMNGTLRSWVHYCMLRMSNGTQREHMDIAKACWSLIANKFPNIAEACINGS